MNSNVPPDRCDHTALFDPEREVPEWFWDCIAQGGQNRESFRLVCESLTRERLRELIIWSDDLAGRWHDAPFWPPANFDATYTTNSMDEVGHWIVSQGKDFFLQVWRDPSLTWQLVRDDVEEHQSERSYYGVASGVWHERFPDEDEPLRSRAGCPRTAASVESSRR